MQGFFSRALKVKAADMAYVSRTQQLHHVRSNQLQLLQKWTQSVWVPELVALARAEP